MMQVGIYSVRMSEMEDSPEERVRVLLKAIRTQIGLDPRIDLDQCPATPSTVIRRLALMGRRSSDILLLGDDDLLSLALAMTGARRRIATIDLDDRLLRLIGSISTLCPVELLRYDLLTGIPRVHRRCFDEVFTDPPYTLAGQLLFVQRALAALRSKVGVRLYLCASRVYLTSQELLAVRSFLLNAGFELETAYPDFNCYKAPPDVRNDLKERGCKCVKWLHSDLFLFVRRRVTLVPRLSASDTDNIYEYPS
jgi:predicted methyltransferase